MKMKLTETEKIAKRYTLKSLSRMAAESVGAIEFAHSEYGVEEARLWAVTHVNLLAAKIKLIMRASQKAGAR